MTFMALFAQLLRLLPIAQQHIIGLSLGVRTGVLILAGVDPVCTTVFCVSNWQTDFPKIC